MRLPRVLLAALVAPLLCAPATARADLTADVERLVETWSAKAGTTVERRATLFLEQGRATSVRLSDPAKGPGASTSAPAAAAPRSTAPAPRSTAPRSTAPTPKSTAPKSTAPTAAAAAAAASAKPLGCTTVVLLAPRTSEVAFLPDGTAEGAVPPPSSLPLGHPVVPRGEGGVIRSRGGIATLARCGKEQAAHPLEAERLLVQSVSPRTAVEVLVVRSQAPIEAADAVLPERAIGPSAPRGDTGRPLDPGPLAARLARVDRRSKEGGAERVLQVAMRASANGGGTFAARLSEGCHTLDVLADVPPSPQRGTDVDAEARAGEGGRLLGRDRGEAPDAHLDFCLGEPTEVEVAFLGASGAVDVTLVDARWPLPPGIPTEWGPEARGDIAAALRRRHAPQLPAEPIVTVMGVQGETLVPFAVEPGECYIAVAALMRGEARSVRLAVEIGDRAPRDEIGADRAEAAQVAFCATTEDRAALRVAARGAQPWWLGLVWRVTR